MFAISSFDRRGQLRQDEDRLRGLLQSNASKSLLWHDGRFAMQPDTPRLFDYADLTSMGLAPDQAIYLGHDRGTEIFGFRLEELPAGTDDVGWIGLRAASHQVDDRLLSLMFYAQGLFNWHQNHSYCSRCGGTMAMVQAGHARQCRNRSCARLSYPKIDPAVIFSIVNQADTDARILLGRQAKWEAKRYSVIAGFVEPGETLEHAVRREALEETGIGLDRVEYVSSQPWPFPDSLMVGFSCTTQQEAIHLVDQELESAAWFRVSDIEDQVRAGSLKLPNQVSLSWHLIDRWFSAERGYSLNRLHAMD